MVTAQQEQIQVFLMEGGGGGGANFGKDCFTVLWQISGI